MSQITLLQLPIDILVNIMKKLNYRDLRNVMLTCRALRELMVGDNSIWRSVSKETLIIHNSLHTRSSTKLSWYNKCRISHNWRKGIYHPKVVIHHKINYMPWLKLHNSQVMLLSVDSELQCYPTDKDNYPNCRLMLWKLQVPTVKRYDVRTNDISRFVVKNNFIVCGNRDGCVSVYSAANIKQKPRLFKHLRDCHENGQVEVTAVELINCNHNPCVVTGSRSDLNLCFWQLNQQFIDRRNEIENSEVNNCVRVINLGDNVGGRCLALSPSEDKLAVGLNGNSKPMLVDVTTGQPTINSDSSKNIRQAVRDVIWHNDNNIAFVTHSGFLQMLDIRSGKVVYDAMDPYQATLYCVKSDAANGILVGCSEYSRCVLFDSRCSRRHVQIYFTQNRSSPVYSLDFDATKLIAASDRNVAVLNFDTRESSQRKDYSHVFDV